LYRLKKALKIMSNKSVKSVQESGEVTAQVANIEVQSFDDSIRSARGGKALSPAVQAVFDKMKTAVEFAQSNDGKAQISFPHSDFPLRKDKLVNGAIANAILTGKKRFSNISFSIVIDAVNREGSRLNASVLRVMVKPQTEETNN
jgi:hypothetical protein